MVGVATTATAGGVTAVVEAGGGGSGAGGGSGHRRWGSFGPNNRGSGRSSGGGSGGRRNGARGRSAWNGSSTYFRLSSASSTDHGEVAVVAGKRGQELWQEEHLGLSLSLSWCVC